MLLTEPRPAAIIRFMSPQVAHPLTFSSCPLIDTHGPLQSVRVTSLRVLLITWPEAQCSHSTCPRARAGFITTILLAHTLLSPPTTQSNQQRRIHAISTNAVRFKSKVRYPAAKVHSAPLEQALDKKLSWSSCLASAILGHFLKISLSILTGLVAAAGSSGAQMLTIHLLLSLRVED